MSFLRPAAFIGLIILPMILALYLFKKKHIEIKVPSVFLWNKAGENQQAEKSIEKLKKNLLMFLQLLAALFCVFAMTEPYITSKSSANKYFLIIDNSLSMAAQEEKLTRLDMAKADAVKLVKESVRGSSFSVVTLNSEQNMIISSDDKDEVIKAINGITQSIMPVDYEQIPEAPEEYSSILYSDMGINSDTISSQVYGSSFDNCGVISLSTGNNGDTVRALVKVKNYGTVPLQKKINIYADGKLYGSKDVSLAPEETKDVIFTRIDGGAKEIRAQLQPNDRFTLDDNAYGVVSESNEKKVLLYGDVNPFMERALSVIPEVKTYREDGSSVPSDYDLYVFDGNIPDTLPDDGHILFINPPENSFFEVKGEEETNNGRLIKNSVLGMTEDSLFSVCKSKKITLPKGAEIIALSGNTPIAFVQSKEKQKLAVIGFELNNSDLPLKKDFPVLVYDLYTYFFPDNAQSAGSIKAGENIKFDISPKAEKVSIIQPDETVVNLAPPFPVSDYHADGFTGIYYLEQIINSKPVYKPFAVNLLGNEELNFSYNSEGSLNEGIERHNIYNFGLKNLILIAALIILLAEIILYILSKKQKAKKAVITLRIICFILLISAVFDPKLPLPAKSVTTVFTLDLSDSMADNSYDAIEFINEALKLKPSGDLTALAAFGRDGNILASASDSAKEYTLNTSADITATNIQGGVETAKSLFKSSTGKRMIIFTDGSETNGDSASAIKALSNEGVEIKFVEYDHDNMAEAEITQLKVPEYISMGKCRSELVITSTAQMNANIQLYANGNKIYENKTELNIGENRFNIETEIKGSGTVNLKGVIEPDVDKYYQNNTAYAHTYIEAAPKVLVLEYNGSGNKLNELIKSASVTTERLDIHSAPKSEDILNNYEAVILADCPYYEMDSDFVTALESYVKNSSGGLLVTGGENSLAPGGYRSTKLEDILPINMDMTDDQRKDTAIVMVVDRSGSMESGNYGISKLELVKEAMVRSIEMLGENDSTGILAFDDGYKWTLKPEKLNGNTEEIKDKIYSINAGGGTSIQPALDEAVNVLSNYNAASKHIILMTDGQGENSGYEDIIRKAVVNNISISTVAAGNDSATDLLESIAKQASGRYYYTDEFTDLPKIFERETALSNKTYVNNVEFYPDVAGESSILTGIEAMPPLEGYIASKAKAAANTILVHDNKEPVLALWQYGLGNTAVFASDIEHQCGKWLNTSEGQKIIKNLLSSVMRDRSFGNIQTDISERNGKKIITIQAKNTSITAINGNITGENYKEKPVFEQVAPGVFETAAEIYNAGNYILNLNMVSEEGESFSSGVISIPYPEEYSISTLASGKMKLEQLYYYGEKIDSPEKVFTNFKDKIYDKLNISIYLIILALILFFTELVLRRFNFIRNKKTLDKKDKEKIAKNKKTSEKIEEKNEEKNTSQSDITNTSNLLLKNKQKRAK